MTRDKNKYFGISNTMQLPIEFEKLKYNEVKDFIVSLDVAVGTINSFLLESDIFTNNPKGKEVIEMHRDRIKKISKWFRENRNREYEEYKRYLDS